MRKGQKRENVRFFYLSLFHFHCNINEINTYGQIKNGNNMARCSGKASDQVDLGKYPTKKTEMDKAWIWPPMKFVKEKQNRFHEVEHILAYIADDRQWGVYQLSYFEEVPTYIVPYRGMTRGERRTPFNTYYKRMKKDVTFRAFARLEPGIDKELATRNAYKVRDYHAHLVALGMDHIWAYDYIVAFFPGSMWEYFTYPFNGPVVAVDEVDDPILPREVKYDVDLKESDDEDAG